MLRRAAEVAFACLLAVSAAQAAEGDIVVGAAVTQSGGQAALAADYRNGLLLWQDDVNAAGGLLSRKVELRLVDDASQAARSAEIYAGLIAQKADLLIGPVGSAATLVAGARAERARRVLINAAGPAHTVHRRSPRYVFQVVAPYAAWSVGILELVRAAGCERLTVLGRDDSASTEMAEAARANAAAMKFAAVSGPEIYSAGSADFAPLVDKAKAAGTDAWLAFGESRDAADMVIRFRRSGYAPAVFFATGAAESDFITRVGRDAEGSLAAIRYDARFATPQNAAFVRAYSERWKAAPGPAAAEAYAAGQVLADAVRRAGSLEQEKLRAALSSMEAGTVLGRYRVNPANGEQVGVQPAVIQIVKGRRQIVWPASLKTAEPNLKCQ